eukprot:TRINITY_DN20706_c0_g1_i1.p1 TRINITY_DN20706_c0_g1~~TRINITY_DN20706_c0_g1_i1.p1  ORF type:complete len:723 (-),score=114.61 TRINITY_DN20706_c0_g1_i1:146-2236(-)
MSGRKDLRFVISKLNNSGVLKEEICINDVVDSLMEAGINDALKILEDLERVAGKITHPTNYILAATSRLLGGSRNPPHRQQARDDTKTISKEIGRLNNSGILTTPILYSDVAGLLADIPSHTALRILKDLEESGSSVKNPTAYVAAAASRKGGSSGPGGGRRMSGGDDFRQISKRIGWLNNEGALAEPISYSDVAGLLEALDQGTALRILEDLEAAGGSVKNPTAYVAAAATRAAGGRGMQAPRGRSDSFSDYGSPDDGRRISRQIGWLNNNVGLKERISYNDVADTLEAIDVAQAMKILKDLENRADTVENPTGYVMKAAQRVAGEHGAAMQPVRYYYIGDTSGEDSKRLSRQIGWLNNNAGLVEKISFSDVVDVLSALDITVAMKILKDLETRATTVENPTGYVAAAARRAADSGQPFQGHRERLVDYGSEEDSRRISRQVGWLNNNVDLRERISYIDVAPALEALDTSAALKILKDLENSAQGVENPTNYICAAARRAGGGYERPPVGHRGRSNSDYSANGGSEDDHRKLSKQIGWLNNNMGFAEKISFQDVIDALSAIGVQQALKILKDLQESGDKVERPTNYILAAVRRVAGGAASRGTKRARSSDEEGTSLSKKIGRLNNTGALSDRINYSEVIGKLELLDDAQAQKILEDLERQGHKVMDPTNYILAAVRRNKEGGQDRRDVSPERRED